MISLYKLIRLISLCMIKSSFTFEDFFFKQIMSVEAEVNLVLTNITINITLLVKELVD